MNKNQLPPLSRAPGEFSNDRDIPVEVQFNTKRMTLLLGLPDEQIDPDLEARLTNSDFKPKEELHVTVLGFKTGAKIAKALKALPENERQTSLDEVAELAQNAGWNITPTGEYYGIEKQYEGEDEPRRSLVELVDCPEIAKFYEALAMIFADIELEVPPAHVTLGTQGNPLGIALNSEQDLEQYGQKLEMS